MASKKRKKITPPTTRHFHLGVVDIPALVSALSRYPSGGGLKKECRAMVRKFRSLYGFGTVKVIGS